MEMPFETESPKSNTRKALYRNSYGVTHCLPEFPYHTPYLQYPLAACQPQVHLYGKVQLHHIALNWKVSSLSGLIHILSA